MNFREFMFAFVPLLVLGALYIALWVERRALAGYAHELLTRRVARRRRPDFIVGDHRDPYLLRWWLLPRNRFFNVYLHCFLRSDDDRALHDHPWHSLSLLLAGEAVEHTIAEGGVRERHWLCAGDWRYRNARFAHRIELPLPWTFGAHPTADTGPQDCWTLFITGPVVREWGFHCPDVGWIHWKRFTAPGDKGQIGPGCGA